MKWVKKNGLYLPDNSSYAQSVNEFSDGTLNELYISIGIYIPRIDSTDFYNWNILGKDTGSRLAYRLNINVTGTNYSGLENGRRLIADTMAGTYKATTYHPNGTWMVYEVLHYKDTSTGDFYTAISAHGYYFTPDKDTGSLVDDTGYLYLYAPASGAEIIYTHLIIDNKLPDWADISAPKFQGIDRPWLSTDGVSPFGIDLHWAMEEGLIDPTDYLHFYTFQELDENGYVPDYGSNPQPLQLFGDAQIVEAYEVAPYTNPTKATFTPTFASSLLSYLAPQSFSTENLSLQLNWIELAKDLWWTASEGPQAPPKEDFITLPAEQVWNGFIPEGVSWEIQQEGSNIYLSTTLVLHAVETEPSVPTTVDDEGRLHFYIFVPEGEMYRITAGALGHRRDEEHAPQLYILWSMPAICLQQGIPPVTVNLKIKL